MRKSQVILAIKTWGKSAYKLFSELITFYFLTDKVIRPASVIAKKSSLLRVE